MNELDNAITKLIETIKQDKDYIRYLDLQNQLTNNLEINELINTIKELQKEATRKGHIGNDIKQLEIDIETKFKQLNNIPLYIEYTNALEKVNDCFSLINKKIDSYIEKEVNF